MLTKTNYAGHNAPVATRGLWGIHNLLENKETLNQGHCSIWQDKCVQMALQVCQNSKNIQHNIGWQT